MKCRGGGAVPDRLAAACRQRYPRAGGTRCSATASHAEVRSAVLPRSSFTSSTDLVLKGRALSKEGKLHRSAFLTHTHTSHPTPKSDLRNRSCCFPATAASRQRTAAAPGRALLALPAPVPGPSVQVRRRRQQRGLLHRQREARPSWLC